MLFHQWGCEPEHFPVVDVGEHVLVAIESDTLQDIVIRTAVVIAEGMDNSHVVILIQDFKTYFSGVDKNMFQLVHKDQLINVVSVCVSENVCLHSQFFLFFFWFCEIASFPIRYTKKSISLPVKMCRIGMSNE